MPPPTELQNRTTEAGFRNARAHETDVCAAPILAASEVPAAALGLNVAAADQPAQPPHSDFSPPNREDDPGRGFGPAGVVFLRVTRPCVSGSSSREIADKIGRASCRERGEVTGGAGV